jgi:hypothetical protein
MANDRANDRAKLNIFFAGLCVLTLLSGCITKPFPANDGMVPKKKDTKSVLNDTTPRKRLMVLPFLDSSETRPDSLRENSKQIFVTKMNQTGDVIVVGSADLKDSPQKEMKGGEYIFASLGPKAADFGVSALLEGKIMDIKVSRQADPVGVFRQVKTKFEVSVRVRLALAKSGKEIFNTTKTVSLEDSMQRVAESVSTDKLIATNPQLVEKLVTEAFLDFQPQIIAALNKLSWEGRIAMINGDRIFLNVGRISGVQVGDLLRVTEEGEEVFDPQTGVFIGKSPGRLKGTLEVISYFGQDGSISVLHSGAGFKENDRVEQY